MSWIDESLKLISRDEGKTWQLYDVVADAAEKNDLAATRPAVVDQMRTECLAWIRSVESERR